MKNNYHIFSKYIYILSKKEFITWEIVVNNSDINWDYDGLSGNPNITWEIIQANPDKPWSYDYLSSNPNINWDIVEDNPDKPWNYVALANNTMDTSREKYIRERFQEWFKRSELKAEIMANVWHPRNFWKFRYLDPETFGEDF